MVVDRGMPQDLVHLLFARGQRAVSSANDGAVEFLENPFELFLAAGVLALLKREWRLANHFLDMATASFEHLQSSYPTSEIRAAEAYYLAALALRIRLGNLVMSAGGEVDAANAVYNSARDALDKCEHRGRDRQATASVRKFREFRLSSERAALELFMAVQCFLAKDSTGGDG